jgi:hypothetical protein
MSSEVLTALSGVEAVVLVLVLATALLRIRVLLMRIASDLAALAEGVGAVEGHLRLIPPTVPTINAPLTDIVGALPSIAELAEQVAGG